MAILNGLLKVTKLNDSVSIPINLYIPDDV